MGARGRRSRNVEVDIGEITDEEDGTSEGVAEDEYGGGWIVEEGKDGKNASSTRMRQRRAGVNGG